MKKGLSWPIFWALLGVFPVLAIAVLVPIEEILRFEVPGGFAVILVLGAAFTLLGGALLFFALREKASRFLMLAGASAAGIVISILLHNFLYGLGIVWFGADFWDRIGLEDEIVFFLMATLVCPIGFLVGAVGSVIVAIRQSRTTK